MKLVYNNLSHISRKLKSQSQGFNNIVESSKRGVFYVQVDITDLAESYNVSHQRILSMVGELSYIYGARVIFYDIPPNMHKGVKIVGFQAEMNRLVLLLSYISLLADKIKNQQKSKTITLISHRIKLQKKYSAFPPTWWDKLNEFILDNFNMVKLKRFNHRLDNKIEYYEVKLYKHFKVMKHE